MSDLLSGLANLTKQVTSNISTYEIRKITEKVQGMVMNYTETENLVREATNEDPWGPTGPQMKEISNLTFQYDGFQQIMPILWKRMLEDNKFAWKRVYKSLTLLDYLLQHGSERVITNSRDHVFQMRSLEHYKFVDEKGKDQGVNIRHRAGIILELLGDDDKLRAARKKAKGDNKDRYQGYTSEDIRMGRGGDFNGGGYSSNKYDDYDSSSGKRKSSFEDSSRNDYSSKEVNSFQFPDEGRRNSVSPELGFRQENNCEEVDDGFGDFAQSRSSAAPAPSLGAASASSFSVTIPSLSPPSSSSRTAVTQPDLLGSFAATDTNSSSNEVDFFAQVPAAPVQVQGTSIRPPRPPSGGLSPANTATFEGSVSQPTGALIDDIFGAPLATTEVKSANENADIFTADWSMASAPAPTSQVPPSSSNTFDAFGSISTSTPVNFSSNDIIPTKSSGNDINLAFDDFSCLNKSTGGNPPTNHADSQSGNKNVAKIGSTWAGTGGLIDLDNLGMKSTSVKPSPSLNQMQKNKTGGTTTNW